MGVLPECREEQPNPIVEKPSSLPFNAILDPSNPLEFLESAIDFVSRNSDFFNRNSADEKITYLVRSAKVKREKAHRKRMKAQAEASAKKTAEEERKKEPLEPTNDNDIDMEENSCVSRNSEFFKSNSADEKIAPLVRSAKVETEEVQRKRMTAEAEASVQIAADEERKNKLLEPTKANGIDMEDHSWGQNLHEVNVTVPVPKGTKSRSLLCEIKKDRLKVGLKGEKPIIQGELSEPVKPDDSFWSLEDNKEIVILLTKCKDNWWNSLFKGGPQIDVQKAEPEPCRLSELDQETRSVVEKMMFDQKQKQMGLPTSDDIKKQELLKQFMAENPKMMAHNQNMNFSKFM